MENVSLRVEILGDIIRKIRPVLLQILIRRCGHSPKIIWENCMQISFKAYIIRFNINGERAKIVKKSMVFSYREGCVSDSRDDDGKGTPHRVAKGMGYGGGGIHPHKRKMCESYDNGRLVLC